MKPIDQDIFNGGGRVGNCFQACVASILELPLEKVPHFFQKHADGENWHEVIWEFLEEFGLTYLEIDVEDKALPYFGDCYHILMGWTVRGTKHAVVAYGYKMVHDPHPSRDGITKTTGIGFIVPITPAVSYDNIAP